MTASGKIGRSEMVEEEKMFSIDHVKAQEDSPSKHAW
jgi:hypothetical protein